MTEAQQVRDLIQRNALALYMGLTRAEMDEYLDHSKRAGVLSVEDMYQSTLPNKYFRMTIFAAATLATANGVDVDQHGDVLDQFGNEVIAAGKEYGDQ